jgi:hypothetical protein
VPGFATTALRAVAIALATAGVSGGPPAQAAPQGLPSRPAGWPKTLALGVVSEPGDPLPSARWGRLDARYHYLSGGANTGRGWTTWASGNGSFVTQYVTASRARGLLPVFSYYQLLQSHSRDPGLDESGQDVANLADATTMRAYFKDLRRFMRLAGAGSRPRIVLHVEPDLWGYIQQHAQNDDAASVPARVASTGLAELRGLPDNAAGVAQAVARLRKLYAPNVSLAYALSSFGTGKDIKLSRPSDAETAMLAARSARFERSLHTRFDLAFTELANRDAGYAQAVEHDGGASWWSAEDHARLAAYLGGFSRAARLRVVLWQIPVGNTVMRAMNQTRGHYQDNKVQWLLGDGARAHLRAYADAGVIGLLFGGALAGATCACDATADGVTDPPPIDGNSAASVSSDDDGGYLSLRTRRYYADGAMRLP